MVDTGFNIDIFYITIKLSSLDLGVVKQVLNHEAHQVSRRLLNIESILELDHDAIAIRCVYLVPRENQLKLAVQVAL